MLHEINHCIVIADHYNVNTNNYHTKAYLNSDKSSIIRTAYGLTFVPGSVGKKCHK